jgi:hypothetical protein
VSSCLAVSKEMQRGIASATKKPADWELRSPIDRQSGVSIIS